MSYKNNIYLQLYVFHLGAFCLKYATVWLYHVAVNFMVERASAQYCTCLSCDSSSLFLKEQYPVTVHVPNFDFLTGILGIQKT